MKTTIRKSLLAVVFAALCMNAGAQQVNTLYFLDNAPVRHYINPAFTPLSNFYLSLPVLGYTSLWAGNNSISMQDAIFRQDGKTVTFLHPDVKDGRQNFLKKLRPSTLIESDMQINLLSFGFRLKDKNYLHFTLNQKSDMGISLPRDLFRMVLTGVMQPDPNDNNRLKGDYNFKALGADISLYTELGLGYTREINEHWSVGGKLKVLFGQGFMGMTNNRLGMSMSDDKWNVDGNGRMMMAAPFDALVDKNGQVLAMPDHLTYDNMKAMFDNGIQLSDWKSLLKPAGMGAAIDLGMTYKPIPQVQISAAVTDLGFISWYKGYRYDYTINGTYDAETMGELKVEDYYTDENGFDGNKLMDTVTTRLKTVADNMLQSSPRQNGFTRMTSARLNIGVDANFWDNRVGVGVYSRTRFFNSQVYEEVTLGAAFRPVHWFNIAASYSFINGRWSSMGAALGLVTYEGLGLFVAMDYIPFTYASMNINDKPKNVLPYKVNGLNLAFGLNIVIGHNRDKDRDGVKDKYDLCPDTPRKVKVDKDGCPLDEDGDGVPDYLDQCPGTPTEARGYIDEFGCPLDTDGDGVPDYKDQCPDTPEAAWGKVDEKGCPLDTDGDGVPDYLDECPDTPKEAAGKVDEKGCLLDTDGDGVPDYMDDCPDTPKEAAGKVDKHGCLLDTDLDGVPDYLDECPDTPRQAYGFVDAKGCLLDTDKDGVPDYIDRCNDTPEGTPVNEWGCSQDSDNDGVPDYKDECPDTPKEARNYVDEKGCPKDTDGDGVPDYLDQCPMQPGPAENHGCPALKKEVRNLLKKAMQGIQFETGKAIIKKTSHPLLNQIANVFIENPTYKVEVQGHTDNVGKEDFNQDLSERRAKAVKDYLVSAGVPESQMTSHGYGMTMPIESNKTAAGRAKNRRVEFVVSFEEISYEEVMDRATPKDSTATAPKDTTAAQTPANAQ